MADPCDNNQETGDCKKCIALRVSSTPRKSLQVLPSPIKAYALTKLLEAMKMTKWSGHIYSDDLQAYYHSRGARLLLDRHGLCHLPQSSLNPYVATR